MSEKVILAWLERLDARMVSVQGEVASLRDSLTNCQARSQATRGTWSRRRGALVKILAGAIVAAAGAFADRYLGK